MDWESALNKLKESSDPEIKLSVISLLHQEIKFGKVNGEILKAELENLYQSEKNPKILSELKRVQNRLQVKTIFGRDLLRLSSPPISDTEKKKIWNDVQSLRSVYNETSKDKNRKDFEASYQVLEKIGEGGMSVVFHGKRRSDNKDVAIKFLKEEFFSSLVMKKRFDRECRLSLSFEHPYITDVLEIDRNEKAGFLIMEYLPIGGVDSIIQDSAMDFNQSLLVIKQAGQAISYIHKKKIVHRDIKLSNLMVEKWEQGKDIKIKLSDFGISKDFSKNALTIIGTRMGTDFYSAPEQRESCEKVDLRADIYSLGVCMYRLLSKTGYPEGDFPPVSKLGIGAPEELDKIIMKCLKIDPGKRYSSVDELLTDINNIKDL